MQPCNLKAIRNSNSWKARILIILIFCLYYFLWWSYLVESTVRRRTTLSSPCCLKLRGKGILPHNPNRSSSCKVSAGFWNFGFIQAWFTLAQRGLKISFKIYYIYSCMYWWLANRQMQFLQLFLRWRLRLLGFVAEKGMRLNIFFVIIHAYHEQPELKKGEVPKISLGNNLTKKPNLE